VSSIRGTYSTAFRAPSVGELYSGNSDDFQSVTDPCDTSQGTRSPEEDANCRADGIADDFEDIRTQLRAIVGGNENLEPETANTFTVGAVFEPKMLPGLAFTVDYWNISLDNAIQAKSGAVILSDCYAQADRVTESCDQIIRNSDGLIIRIDDTLQNIGGLDTAGVDFGVRYSHTTPYGMFRHGLRGNWLQNYSEIQPDDRVVDGKGVYDLGVFPAFKFNFSSQWTLNEFGGGINVRYIDSFIECEDNDCSVDGAIQRDVSANVTADIFAAYTLKSSIGTSRLSIGINNALNQDPAVIFNGSTATSDPESYDFLGRYFYARFSQTY